MKNSVRVKLVCYDEARDPVRRFIPDDDIDIITGDTFDNGDDHDIDIDNNNETTKAIPQTFPKILSIPQTFPKIQQMDFWQTIPTTVMMTTTTTTTSTTSKQQLKLQTTLCYASSRDGKWIREDSRSQKKTGSTFQKITFPSNQASIFAVHYNSCC